jgi:hypothetical protein
MTRCLMLNASTGTRAQRADSWTRCLLVELKRNPISNPVPGSASQGRVSAIGPALRFYCGGHQVRVSYRIARDRRFIMLTVFSKIRMRETAEIGRAEAVMARCQEEAHTAGGEG